MSTKDQENNAVLLKSILGDLVESVKLSDGYNNCLNEYTSLTETKQGYPTKEKNYRTTSKRFLRPIMKGKRLRYFFHTRTRFRVSWIPHLVTTFLPLWLISINRYQINSGNATATFRRLRRYYRISL